MKSLLITPVMCADCGVRAEPTPIDVVPGPGGTDLPGSSATFLLWLENDGRLRANRSDSALDAAPNDDSVVALLNHDCRSRDSAWLLVACTNQVALNGLAPPLPVAVIEPGMLLAIGQRCWLVSSLWRPEPVSAPAPIRNKPCPVCGGELGLAPVVQCNCGRWMHLENAAVPDDQDALNCFLAAGVCGGCGRRASLEPQIIPDVPEKLAEWQSDEDNWEPTPYGVG